MPNDLTAKRNLLNSRDDVRSESQRQKLTSSSFTASIWTISGVVLVACGNIEDFLGIDDGGGGGGRALHVHKSPVQGARLYFDVDGDGVIDASPNGADRMLQDAEHPQGFFSDAEGRVFNVPNEFYGTPFVAVLDGAFDADTGESLSGMLHSIPDENGQHTLASPITDFIEGMISRQSGEALTPEALLAEVTRIVEQIDPNADTEAAVNEFLGMVSEPTNYDGSSGVDAFARFLDEAQSTPTPAVAMAEFAKFLGDNPSASFAADVTESAVTIGANDEYITTIEAVSPTGAVEYNIVASAGSDAFTVNERGVILVREGMIPTSTNLQITVTNDDGDSETVSVAITVMDAPSLNELPAGDEMGMVVENVEGAASGGTPLIMGITPTATLTNPTWVIREAVPAGLDFAERFEIVADSTTPGTFNLVLSSGESLDHEAIPDGVLNLHVWAVENGVRSNALTLSITVTDANDAPMFIPTGDDTLVNDGDMIMLAESAGQGHVVARVRALDVDSSSPNNQVSYAITAGNTGNVFDIDDNGAITVASGATLDFDTAPTSYTLTITARNGALPQTDTMMLTISLTGVDDESPAIMHPSERTSTVRITDGTPSATETGTGYRITVTDVDSTTFNFNINGGSGRFDFVDRGSGVWELVLLANQEVNETVGDTITLSYSVVDGGGNSVDGGRIMLEVVETPVEFTSPAAGARTIDLAEDTTADSTVHFTVQATSEDDGGTTVGIASYMFLDDSDTATTTYRGFEIDSSSGEITLTGSLDHEDTHEDGSTINLRVEATDMNTPPETNILRLTVNVGDVNDNDPVFVMADANNGLDYTPTIPENTGVGSEVARVRADDADGTALHNTVSYSITAGNTGNIFDIDANGVITLLSALDYETATSHTLEITATDGTTPITETVTVTVGDVNDVVPMVTPPPQSGVFRVRTTDGLPAAEIAQNSAAGTGYRITIDDADTNNVFTFNVSDPRFEFQAQGSADVTWELMLLAGQEVPEEEGGTITLTYHVNDGVANSVNVGQTTVMLNVVDTPVEFATPTAAALMADENDADWTLTVMATSLGSNSDGGDSVIASYEIVEVLDENDMVVASDGVFRIADRTIGKISISAGLDYETSASYTLVIQATDTVESMVPGDTADTNTERFTINLRDVNEHNPVFFTKADDPDLVANGDTVELAENAAAGTVVAQVRAMDADGTSTVEYGITAGAGSNFVIDEETGVITVASGATFDYDGATKSYRLTVRAYDGPSTDPNASESDGQQITINLTDVNDNPPMVTADAGEIRTTTGNADNTETGYSITVTDADTVGTLMVDSDDERFRFDRDGTTDTWNLILLANQAVTAGTISFGYSATDGDNPPATGTITLMAVDTPVKFTAPAANDLIITENDSTNAWTVTITATSLGSNSDNTNSAISGYELLEVLDADGMTVDMNGVFSITDAGVISVSGALDHETSAYYTLRIQATDTVESGVSGDEADTGTTDLRVNVGDVNEADPVIEGSPTADAFVTTGATGGTEVTTVVVTDADTSQTFTYAITSGNTGNAFAIDNNGVITVASGTTLNRATTATYDLVVTVTDNGVNASDTADPKSDTQNIKVTVRETTTSIAEQVQGASVQSGTDAADVIDRGTQTGFEVIQGGDLSDTITVGSGGSVVFGGYGSDTITLGDGVDTVVHRFASVKGIWRNDDGADVIRDFELGKDKFILVDTDDNPIDLTTFLDETISGSHSILGPDDMQPIAERGAAGVLIRALPDLDADDLTYIGVAITISTPVKQDGPGGEDPNTAAIEIQIYWDESFVIDPNGTPDADNYERFLGIVDLVGFTGGQLNLENDFTDYSILPTYLNDDDTTRGFDVISLDDLGVEII